jgi:hypothetical protein
MANIPLPAGMEAHLVTVVDILTTLHEISLARDHTPFQENRGRPVLIEAMVLDEPASHALLFDFATTLRDERSKDGAVFRL